jgi:CDP-6-deoxy-D-xylo-4-hexulose-3-dehydrase
MVRECGSEDMSNAYKKKYPTLNPDFIFAYPAYNMRNTEIGGILGQNQLKYLDENVKLRNKNLFHFLSKLDQRKYKVDFRLIGCSNYAFNIVLEHDYCTEFFVNRLMGKMRDEGIEFRRGSAGGGNQLRQPYLKNFIKKINFKNFTQVDHVHFFGYYIGNYPTLNHQKIIQICKILNDIKYE